MKKSFYLITAAVLSLTTVNAQTVFDKDITITEPYEIADYNNSETHVVIDGATVTFGNEAMNTCGLPFGDGTQIILENGAKLVFFNSPDNWYADPESDANEDFADYMYDANSNIITSVLYNFVVEGSATIVCDSKCHFGGTVCGGGELTLFVGDSTIINNDLDAYLDGVEGEHGFTGRLYMEYKEDALNNTILFGSSFPGTCKNSACNGAYLGNPSSKCWCSIPWTLVVPDGTLLREAEGSIGNSHIAFPEIEGRFSMYAPATITLKPGKDCVYDFDSITGGGETRNFEIYAGGNITFNTPIDYVCGYIYPRNKSVGVWINSEEPCFVNCLNEISVRNNDGFVGGNGILDCSILCKVGNTTHICPGNGQFIIGDFTVNRNVTLNNNNAIDVDFGPGGTSDRLLVKGNCYIGGAYTRLWLNLTSEFYTNPVAGDYKVIDATNFIPNTIYTTDTTGIRYEMYDDFQAFIDSISVENDNADKDSIYNAWAKKFQYIEQIDTTNIEIMQSLVVLANKLENGNSCDSLPEGYSWYPLEWDNEGYSDEELATKKNELMSEKFFTKGIISIYGPNYKEGTVVNDVVNGIDDVKIDNIGKKIIETRIYTLDGREVIYPEMGINIVRYKYEDGSIESKKIIRIHE